MAIVECRICGTLFTSTSGGKYCSDQCRNVQKKRSFQEYLKRKRAETKAVRDLEANSLPKLRRLTVTEKRELNKRITSSRAWLEEYNASGAHGGDAMLASEAKMTYTEWMKLPLSMRWDRKEEILEIKRYYARKSLQRI